MFVPKSCPRAARRSAAFAAFAASLALGFLSHHAGAAVVTYNFDVNGSNTGFGVTNGSTYDWDATTNGGFWSNNSVATNGSIATNGWVQGNFPKFQPASGPAYTVTVSNDEQVAGMFFSTPQAVTINAVGAGDLNIVAGLQGVLGSSSADVTINAPIVGTGEIQPSNGGNIRLNGVNTYSGGTNLSSTATLVHFNNSSSFGTNFINMGVAGFAPLLASGGHTVTIPNNFTTSVNNAGINFAADPNTPVVSTGTWTLGTNNLVLRNNGVGASTLTLANAISGSGIITLSSNFGGTISLTGPGGSGSGNSGVTLKLGAPNTIASVATLILTGGTLDPGGFDHKNMTSTTLLVNPSNAPSTIDFASGPSEVDFEDSSAFPWSGTLNIANWNPSLDKLRFGTDSNGLTPDQLAAIEFNGGGFGTASLDPNGYLVSPTPEPSAAALVLGAPLLLLLRRRRATGR